MKCLRHILPWLIPLSASGSVYTIAAPHLTMHAGDPLPPLIFRISPSPAHYADIFTGEPVRSTNATSGSPPGDYPIHIVQGSLKLANGSDRLVLADGVLTILPAGPVGAKLVNSIDYPPGFLDGPSGYPVLDVTRNPTANLVPDCKTDNAQAFRLLLSQKGLRTPASTNGGASPLFLYFPPGCYATSEALTIYGNTWSFWGSGPQRSYLRLLPNSSAFNIGRPVAFFDPQSVTKNSNFREYIYNLGFNIGVGNPDAVPFTTVQNNSGAVRNVQIWADDSNCPSAVRFDRQYPGPMLFKNVAIYGCRTAYSASQNEYSVTFENLTTEAQTETVLDNGSLTVSIRHWFSDNAVPALHVYGRVTANVALLDSEIRNGSPEIAGIRVDQGSALYIEHLISTGYSPTEIDSGTGSAVQRSGNIAQAWTGSGRSVFNTAQGPDSLHLPVRETPDPKDPPAAEWTKFDVHAEKWPEQLRQTTSSTVYAPPGIYPPVGVVELSVPDSVNHLQFFQSKFPTGAPQIVLTVAGSSRIPLVIDSCPYESCQLLHTGSRAIVLRDTTLNSYEARDGAGDVYIEDSMLNFGPRGGPTLTFYPSQRIWARQLNLEQKNADKLHCIGCTLWILGYKTEQPPSSVVLLNHARAEIFGFFFYMNVAPLTPGTANIHLTDSSLFAFGWTKVDKAGRGHPNWVLEDQGERSAALATHDVDSSQQLNFFYSFGGGRADDGSSGRNDAGGQR
jgi:Pectate lyase superfamily protein